MRRALLSIALLVACDAPGPGDTLPSCRVDSDCDDGLFCNGAERCDPRTPLGCLPGAAPCAMGCDERIGCVACEPPDGDGDGARARACGGPDCDDTDPDVAPGTAERCDGRDDDCDGRVDEELEAVYLDADGDGHGDPETALGACTTLPVAAARDDCDDDDPDVHPGAADTCDGRDEDCSGVIDDGAPETLCALPGVASATCDAGHCTLVRCDDGRGDCDGRVANGCEISTASDVHHCGACDAPCSGEGTVVCAAGACELAVCPAGRHVCGDRCVSDFSTESCGPSCTPCERSSAHGGAHCDGYRCTTYCDPGYATNTETGGLECLWASSRLTDLVPSEGVLSHLTDRGYHVLQVSAASAHIRFTPVTDPRAVVTIEIAGVAVTANELSPPFALRPGSNGLFVHVTSPAGGESWYALDVRRGELSTSEIGAPSSSSFGWSLAADGNVLVVGQPSARAAHVLEHDGSAWVETALLTASDRERDDSFGSTVAIDGDRIAVGAPNAAEPPGAGAVSLAGSVYVFRREAGAWVQEAKLVSDVALEWERFGGRLALEGDLLAVGRDGGEKVWLFRRTGSVWSLEQRFDIPSSRGVALSRGALLIGAPLEGGVGGATPSAGAVRVLERIAGTWIETTVLRAPTPMVGELFGASVAAYDGWIAVGAPGASGYDPTGFDPTVAAAGAAYLFRRDDWAPVATARPPFPGRDVRLGEDLAMGEDGLVLRAPYGETLAFELDPATWAVRSVWPLAASRGTAVAPNAFVLGDLGGARLRLYTRSR